MPIWRQSAYGRSMYYWVDSSLLIHVSHLGTEPWKTFPTFSICDCQMNNVALKCCCDHLRQQWEFLCEFRSFLTWIRATLVKSHWIFLLTSKCLSWMKISLKEVGTMRMNNFIRYEQQQETMRYLKIQLNPEVMLRWYPHSEFGIAHTFLQLWDVLTPLTFSCLGRSCTFGELVFFRICQKISYVLPGGIINYKWKIEERKQGKFRVINLHLCGRSHNVAFIQGMCFLGVCFAWESNPKPLCC